MQHVLFCGKLKYHPCQTAIRRNMSTLGHRHSWAMKEIVWYIAPHAVIQFCIKTTSKACSFLQLSAGELSPQNKLPFIKQNPSSDLNLSLESQLNWFQISRGKAWSVYFNGVFLVAEKFQWQVPPWDFQKKGWAQPGKGGDLEVYSLSAPPKWRSDVILLKMDGTAGKGS